MPSASGDVESPADERRAFLHAEKSQGARIAELRFGDAAPVIANLKFDDTTSVDERDVDGARARVPDDVGQRLLNTIVGVLCSAWSRPVGGRDNTDQFSRERHGFPAKAAADRDDRASRDASPW